MIMLQSVIFVPLTVTILQLIINNIENDLFVNEDDFNLYKCISKRTVLHYIPPLLKTKFHSHDILLLNP